MKHVYSVPIILSLTAKETSRVNANVNVMGSATEQIRVSDEIKRELERRKRDDESFNDVLERVLEDDRDLLAGFGSWSDERAEHAREVRQKRKEESKKRIERLTEPNESS